MCVGERSAWNASTPITLGAWRLFPGSVKSGRIERAGLLAIRAECLAVLVEPGVEATWPPTREHLFHGLDVHAQEVGEGLEVRRERDDRTDVQIASGPAIETLADAGGER